MALRPTVASLAAPSTKARTAAAAARAAPADTTGISDAALELMLRPVHAPPPHGAGERSRRRRNMEARTRLVRAQWLEGERKANAFLAAKWGAIDALPHARRVEAVSGVMGDGTRLAPRLAPRDTPIWTETPAIPGFDVGKLTGT